MFEPRRNLGRTGFKATVLGIGDLADRQIPLARCVDTVRRAMDAGLNVIDTAPGYEAGYSEEIVGRALRQRRDGIFVIDKIDHPDRSVAAQVEASLRRLGLAQVDLFVFHAISTLEGWARLRVEELDACVQAGKARFRGVSSHHPDVVRAAILSGWCDVVMFPVGPFVDLRYVRELLPLARARGVGTVCFKTFGAGKLVGDTAGYNQPLRQRPRGKLSSGGVAGRPELPHLTPEECLHYTLSCDPDVALLGMSFPNEQDAAFTAMRTFRQLAPPLMADVRRRAALAVRDKGPCWWNPA